MKIIISVLNSKYIHSSLAPWYIFEYLKSKSLTDVSVKVMEGTINENINTVAERIIKEEPDVLAFGVYIWNKTSTYKLVSLIKNSLPNCRIVLGGPEVSYNPRDVFTENRDIDYIIAGEGEEPFFRLISSLKSDKLPPVGFGISYRKDNGYIIDDPYISNFEPISPYGEEYFQALKGRIAYIESSRGCPYSCAFCLSGRQGNVRYFDLNKTKENILLLSNSGTKTVKFVDRTFNANKKRAYEIIDFIINGYDSVIPKNVCFHFEIAGDILDDSLISLLNSAPKGLFQLEIGLQSFNEVTLSAINRKTNTSVLKENIKKLISPRNIHIHIDLIAGLPFEDLDSFKESFETAYNLNSDMLQLGFLKILHGSPMDAPSWKYPCKYSDAPPYEVISTKWLSENDIEILKMIEDTLDRCYNKGRLKRSLKYIISCGYSPFDLFKEFGKYAVSYKSCSLDEYSRHFYDYWCSKPNVDKAKLRDHMVCDRIATVKNALIPDFLKIKDANLKKIRNYINSLPEYKRDSNTKRVFSILYSQNKVVFSDYTERDPVTGEYELKYVEMKKD